MVSRCCCDLANMYSFFLRYRNYQKIFGIARTDWFKFWGSITDALIRLDHGVVDAIWLDLEYLNNWLQMYCLRSIFFLSLDKKKTTTTTTTTTLRYTLIRKNN